MRFPIPPLALIALAPLALAACDVKVATENKADSAAVSIGGPDEVASLATKNGSTTVSIPGLGTSITVPKFNLGGKTMNLDGMQVYPGTEIVTMDIKDSKRNADGGGSVRIGFNSGDAPTAIADYYRKAAADAGFTVDAASGTSGVHGTKPDGKEFAVSIEPAGTGSRGTIILNDAD
ncbi:hypothetical protein PQ455_09685 [Sphingomonas naphthae]|uniref:Lipoprotein n=1 Tax=Sphingomonas naphthae TaxID=1813468 RepID=A0ABY7TG67_9SPHN|nr:hypothetical protein [Sphingomonas naphthae]WCT71925.1 hypothetical protein PQ455_09685 [Sphingomonas naphthae]